MRERIYTRIEIEEILDSVIGKTLGEADVNDVFSRTLGKPKITGIAGIVIEESVLAYGTDNLQKPDIIVDGKDVEVKTTGIRRNNKTDKFEAKEPMSITTVSPKKIVHEEFFDSNFWHKLERLLLVFYHYDSEVTVPSWGYANFPIKGYDFISPEPDETEKLKNDWEIIRDFIRSVQLEFKENPESQYHRISTDLKSKLMLIDTAPKYPNPPRFRLKRATVNKIVQEALGKTYGELPEDYNSFEEFDQKLKELSNEYRNMTVRELLDTLNINYKLNSKGDVTKAIGEQIITKMFDSDKSKMSNIDLFAEVGIIGKTIVITSTGGRTEDTKFFNIDFAEIKDENLAFVNSQFYEYFSQNQFLFIVFEERNMSGKLLNNRFLGFKRLSFSEEFIENEVKRTWDEIRYLVNENKLEDVVVRYKDGRPKINKTGVVSCAPNFPKSTDHPVFVRGTSSDSTHKPFQLNGIDMYYQQIWIKGSALVERLNSLNFV